MSNEDTHYLITYKRPDKSVSNMIRDGSIAAERAVAMLMDDDCQDIKLFECVPCQIAVIKEHTVTIVPNIPMPTTLGPAPAPNTFGEEYAAQKESILSINRKGLSE